MKCDKCGNESKYAVKILSEEQDITNTRTTRRRDLSKLLSLHLWM